MDSYIIQVQPQDELTIVIDKIIHTQAERVFLLVPEQSRVAQHALNFRLLKREADALGKEIIVVSESPRVQNLALKSSLQAHQETPELRQNAAEVLEGEPVMPRRFADIFISPGGASEQMNKPIAKPVPEKTAKEQRIVVEKIEKKAPPTQFSKEGKKENETEEEKKITSFWAKRPTIQLPALPAIIERKKLAFPIPKKVLLLKNAARDVVSRISVPSIPRGLGSASAFRAFLFFLVGISAVIAAVTFYSILPKAKIYVVPVVDEVVLEMSLKGDINSLEVVREKFIIPAQIFEKASEKVKTASVSGDKEIREKATGIMTVYNSYSSAPQTLVKTTRFVSQDGKLFRTNETVVVPGAKVEDGKIVPSFTTVPAVASEAGAEYNIGPSTFSIPGFKGTPKYLAFYGETKAPMKGGQVGTVQVVSDDDYNTLKKQLEEELREAAAAALEMALPEGFLVPTGAKEVGALKLTSSHKVGEITGEFSMTGSISEKVFAVRKMDVSDLLQKDFEERFAGKKLIANGTEITYKVSALNFQKGTFDFSATLLEKAAAIVEKELIQKGISGRTEEEVRSFLASEAGIKETRVTFWPFWVKEMPQDSSKIQVIIEEFPGPR